MIIINRQSVRSQISEFRFVDIPDIGEMRKACRSDVRLMIKADKVAV